MYQCPISYYTDNIIFGADGSCWAIYSLKGYDYDLLSKQSKINVLYQLTRFIANFTEEIKILIIPTIQDLENQFEQLKKGLDKSDPLYQYANNHANMTQQYLQEAIQFNGQSNDYKTFFTVKILENMDNKQILKGIKESFDFFIKSPINAINVLMDNDTKMIMNSKIKECKRLANKFLTENSGRFQLEEVNTDTVQWILRRMMYRGYKCYNKNVHFCLFNHVQIISIVYSIIEVIK